MGVAVVDVAVPNENAELAAGVEAPNPVLKDIFKIFFL